MTCVRKKLFLFFTAQCRSIVLNPVPPDGLKEISAGGHS
jgi:hypothetical protein